MGWPEVNEKTSPWEFKQNNRHSKGYMSHTKTDQHMSHTEMGQHMSCAVMPWNGSTHEVRQSDRLMTQRSDCVVHLLRQVA